MKKVLIPLFLLLLSFAVVYVGSEIRLHTFDWPPEFEGVVAEDAATIERGRHAMRIRGCFGCHGQKLEGRVFTEQWEWVKKAVAPNLAQYAKTYDVATLERAIRHGVGADGRALWSMPSYNFVHVSDDDLLAMIAYMRSAPVVEKPLPEPDWGWKVRWEALTGSFPHAVAYSEQVPRLRVDAEQQPQLARGEYLAMTTCNECHGLDLRGEVFPDMTTPDLAVMMKIYSPEDFRRLLQQGVAIGGRTDLGLMSLVIPDRFPYLTEQELTDLYAFLRALAEGRAYVPESH
ncbi:c-type cytochrome [Marinicella sp. W31]|uniref:c-type cytochrome n=1 Tax=Marinicella sp. W31 TaxID=3023713 RepID=UPI0037570AEC